MPELPEVTQGFEANVTAYLAAMDELITKAEEVAAAVAQDELAMAEFALTADAAASQLASAANAADNLRNATAGAGAAAGAAADTVASLRNNLLGLAGADEIVANSMEDLTRIGAYLNTTFGIILTQYGLVMARSAELDAMNRSLSESFGNVGTAMNHASISAAELAAMNERLAASFGSVVADTQLEANQARLLAEADTLAAEAAALLARNSAEAAARQAELAATGIYAAASLGAVADATDKAGAAASRTYGWWGLTGNAIHWIVMGTLEIASTAIPAMVAFGAAIVAMTPAFTFIKDQMTNLVIASGSFTNAIRNSASPLNGLAAGLGKVQAAATPDAFIIFGSAISIVTSHMGVFSGVAAQAANVLASFASKLATELSGPMGQQLAGFFSNAVKYMIQWGQFLGNIGHTFVNVVNSMWGVGQLLLDVLTMISHVLLVITNNPVGAFFIGLAAAMSAAYRYAQLLVTVFNWLGGSALVSAIKWAVGYTSALIGLAAEEGVVAAATLALGDLMAAVFTPVGIAIMAIVAALGIWYLATRKSADATTNLIKQVQSAPPTLMNLSSGIVTLTNALGPATQHMDQLNKITSNFKDNAGLQYMRSQATADVNALSTAIVQQQGKLAHLEIALAQIGGTTGLVGANMTALSIATDLQDSKLQALNQAWDQYFSILSGGMSSVAAFATSIQNIGQVAGTTTQNLGTTVGTLNLTTKQFSDMLAAGAVKGAAAWTNFTQITQSTIPQMINWFQTAQTVGAISSQNFSKSVLDMIAPLMQFATHGGPAAQAILVGLAQAAGLGITSFPQLAAAIKTNNASLGNLSTQATNATIAMSQMNAIAKNLSNTLSVQEANAIANAALKASGFTTDVNNMLKAEQTHSTVGGLTWQQWAAKAAAAQAQVQRDAAKSVSEIQAIQRAEDALHNKSITITVNTVYHTTGSATAAALGSGSSGGAKPGLPQGLAGGGYLDGPGTKHSDSIPLFGSRGEFMMSAAAVDHYGKPFFDALNARKLAGGGPAVGHGGTHAEPWGVFGGGPHGAPTVLGLNSTFQVKLDNATIATAQRREVLIYDRRNPSSLWSLPRR